MTNLVQENGMSNMKAYSPILQSECTGHKAIEVYFEYSLAP